MNISIKYYLFFIPTFITFFVLSVLLDFSTEIYISFFISISFAGLYCHPNRIEYFKDRHSRLNFANALNNYFVILEGKLPETRIGDFLVRQIPGFSFFLLTMITGFSLRAVLSYLIGVLLFELTYYLFIKNTFEQTNQDGL